MNNRLSEGKDHMSPQGLAVWLNGAATPEEETRILDHLIHCSACREQMVMIRQATQPDAAITESPEFDHLLRLSDQAAQNVWVQQQTPASSVTQPIEETNWWERFRRPALRWAAAAVLLLAIVVPVYRFYQGNQPVERAMASMRQAWPQSRPIEARVTGGFPYLPYQVTRGGGASVPVNQGQLLAATAELAREVADRPTSRARHALGKLHLLKEEYDQAEEQLKLVIKEEPQNSLAQVDLASVYYERGLREKSLPLLTQAAELLTKATEISPKLAEAWFNLALCHERMVLPTQAQADWKRYLELDSNSPWATEARAHMERLVNPNKSFIGPNRLAEDLLDAAASNDEEKFRQLALNNFITAFNLGREDFLDKYLAARAANDHLTAAKYLDVIRRVARLAKEEKAEHYLADLVAFVANAKQSVIERVKEIRTLLRQGDQSHEKGDYTNALSSYEKAVAMAELIQDACHAEHARYGLARIYIPSIETTERQRLRERIVRETRKRNHKVLYARSLLSLANALGAAQLHTEGLEASVTAYQTALPLGDFDTVVNGLRFSGSAYSILGDGENAVDKSFQAIRVVSEHAASSLRGCQAYLRMAETFSRAANPDQALVYQLEALQYCQRTGNPSLSIQAKSGAGLYYSLCGQPQKADALFRESAIELEKYGDKLGQVFQRTELSILTGDAYLRHLQFKEAAEEYQRALGLVVGSEHRIYQAMAHQGLATAFLRQGQYAEAETELLLSIELAEDIRKNIGDARYRGGFLGRKLDIYRTMIEFQFAARNDFEKAFYYAELSRNRELFDAIATQSVIKWDAQRATLEYAAADEVPDLKRIQSILPDNTQLAEYAIVDQHLLIWLITNSRWKSYSIPIGSHQLRLLCAEYLSELQFVHRSESLNNRAADLYRKLIEPLIRDLDPNRILIIVPDGILGAIPFPALFSAESKRHLIEDYTIVTIPSAGILSQTLKIGQVSKKKLPESLLVLSNPNFDPKQFPSLRPLPATEQEATEIISYYTVSMSLSRERANKSTLLQNIDQYSTIHLATHSITNGQNPLLSSVILSPEGQSVSAAIDGNLRAFEIFGLKLTHPRLVILSSCRSGLNAQSASNGLGGLAHAFFKAGVPAVIASLWEVEDQSTAELMKNFHYFHTVEKQPFCQALRSAQLHMLNKKDSPWKHPYYWAAFQFSGNGFTS